MSKLAKTFFTSRHNTLIGIGLACVMGVLAYFGLFYQQKAVAQDYPVQGFDVSHHQGDINWKKYHRKNSNSSI